MCTDIFSLPLRGLQGTFVIPFSKITESRVYYGAHVYSIVILEIIVKISMENSFFYITIINKRDEIY